MNPIDKKKLLELRKKLDSLSEKKKIVRVEGKPRECTKCHVVKPVRDYYILTGGTVQGHCKDCHKAYQKAYYEEKAELIRLKHRIKWIENKQKGES